MLLHNLRFFSYGSEKGMIFNSIGNGGATALDEFHEYHRESAQRILKKSIRYSQIL